MAIRKLAGGDPPVLSAFLTQPFVTATVSHGGALLLGTLLLLGCGGGSSEEEAKKSMKQFELAVGLQAEGNLPGAYHSLYQAIELDPNNPHAHLLLGNLFLTHREEDAGIHDADAEKELRDVLRIQASDDRVEENLAADARNSLGVLFINQSRLDEAVTILNEAVADLFNRQAYLAWGNLGWAFNAKGQFQQAAQALTRSVQLNQRFCVGYYRLGQAFVGLRQFDKAETALTQALEVDERCKQFQEAWFLRGETRANLGHRADAIVDFEHCVELGPSTTAGQACGRYLEATH